MWDTPNAGVEFLVIDYSKVVFILFRFGLFISK